MRLTQSRHAELPGGSAKKRTIHAVISFGAQRTTKLPPGWSVEVFHAGSIGEIDTAFARLVQKGADALVVGSSSFLSSRGVQLATLATYHRLPAIYYNRRIVERGRLGADIFDAVRQCGVYVGRILKGEKPGACPLRRRSSSSSSSTSGRRGR